ncbi:hypothetical protein [Synechococcus sp. PCC 7336]|uniref:hypothetical protein n=1 Tax=Synechococcus sp. PCC 7336 TaxID=195250 RepID=UPI0012EA4B0E|nr:hypothetical protein [Synechococcus sp. PCC 7336]
MKIVSRNILEKEYLSCSSIHIQDFFLDETWGSLPIKSSTNEWILMDIFSSKNIEEIELMYAIFYCASLVRDEGIYFLYPGRNASQDHNEWGHYIEIPALEDISEEIYSSDSEYKSCFYQSIFNINPFYRLLSSSGKWALEVGDKTILIGGSKEFILALTELLPNIKKRYLTLISNIQYDYDSGQIKDVHWLIDILKNIFSKEKFNELLLNFPCLKE